MCDFRQLSGIYWTSSSAVCYAVISQILGWPQTLAPTASLLAAAHGLVKRWSSGPIIPLLCQSLPVLPAHDDSHFEAVACNRGRQIERLSNVTAPTQATRATHDHTHLGDNLSLLTHLSLSYPNAEWMEWVMDRSESAALSKSERQDFPSTWLRIMAGARDERDQRSPVSAIGHRLLLFLFCSVPMDCAHHRRGQPIVY
ncbi:hypothetical protein F5Y15DRAFT_22922 [Xylariaceae sp. FL0016]|nr:hypothetical protein F5Y15DRAFT_22922 [Xylariaceae sp. FL0016]